MIKFNKILTIGSVVFIAGCTGGKQNSRLDQREEREFNFGSLRDNEFSLFKNEPSLSKEKLWASTLDVINTTPILVADYKGGIITTDWYTKDSAKNRLKLTLRIKEDNTLNVTAFKQVLKNKVWVDDGFSKDAADTIKEKIMTPYDKD